MVLFLPLLGKGQEHRCHCLSEDRALEGSLDSEFRIQNFLTILARLDLMGMHLYSPRWWGDPHQAATPCICPLVPHPHPRQAKGRVGCMQAAGQ